MAADSSLPASAPGVAHPPFPAIQVTLEGHLTEAALAVALDRADIELRAAKVPTALVVNCLNMAGYDSAARSLFVSWNSRHKRKFFCVAVITTNKLWHMVVSSMSLASSQKMKAFNALGEAGPWISAQARRRAG
jgi:hypothetical protein